ncbi:MAG: elongation factor P maturation arginine rhamnosyltransferase EarP [Giesbergeria sp.]
MSALPSHNSHSWQWDVFCQVIDNFGDIGVCWRLASQLAAADQRVRLWVDDASALAWMAPEGAPGVQVRSWGALPAADEPPTDVLVEAFGCEIAPAFIAACTDRVSAGAQKPVWINLEYLSAESWVPRHHGLPSPVLHGPAAGWTKWFYYPGFGAGTGGLLREENLIDRVQAFDRGAWRREQEGGAPEQAQRWVSLFCYEPPALGDWLQQCARGAAAHTRLLVTPGRAQHAVQVAMQEISDKIGLRRLSGMPGQLHILNMNARPQPAYDELLWACDLNFVRGEDSLVRALWAGRPLVWHIYPQDDGAHGPKLGAFLDWLQAPPSLRHFHWVWNGLAPGALPIVDAEVLKNWGACIRAAREHLLEQNDLLSQLLGFCASKR